MVKSSRPNNTSINPLPIIFFESTEIYNPIPNRAIKRPVKINTNDICKLNGEEGAPNKLIDIIKGS